jgi:acetoacetyl-CoA synthetase
VTINESDVLWRPDARWIENANVTKFQRWLERERGLSFADYDSLWRWSVDDLEGFWGALWEYFHIQSSAPYERVLASDAMPGARWFPGARLNYAEHLIAALRPGAPALYHASESEPARPLPSDELGARVRALGQRLRELGIGPGDRVASYMPNIPETVIAMLATTAIGAVWSSCSPDFGTKGVLDRLAQLKPKLLFAVDGYRYGGKVYDRRAELAGIIGGLPSLEYVVGLSRHAPFDLATGEARLLSWESLFDREPAADFRFEQVAFDAPLWILFSSGTTGLPKAIVHGHGGILLESLKSLTFHFDLHEGETAFFYSTTGWMMWNAVVSMPLAGARPLLYDGHPTYPDVSTLWRLADDCGAALFGASPSYVDMLRKAGFSPKEHFKLERLRAIVPAGSPVSPECGAWFYDNVKPNLWLATGSGGTDVCSGLVGGVPTLPVRAGEIQARQLGVAVDCFDEDGRSLVGEVGELVVKRPMPSMPVALWGDESGERYRDAYFDKYPGIWRHGDLFRINARGGCFVLGRSDATLNRHGVRIGPAEIYRALESVPEVADSLIVNLDLPGGRFFMPLFVKLKPGLTLDEALQQRIAATIRDACSPRHVPDRIIAVDEIPYTLTGKKMEVPVRRILMGAPPDKAANRSAMAIPKALDAIVAYAERQTDFSYLPGARRQGAAP